MMLAMQNRLVALCVVVLVFEARRGRGFGLRHLLPRSVADPGALLLTGILDIEETKGLAARLQLVLNFTGKGQGLRAREVDAAVSQFPAVEYGDGDEAAGLGFAGIAGPLEDRDGAKFRLVFIGLADLAGILGGC